MTSRTMRCAAATGLAATLLLAPAGAWSQQPGSEPERPATLPQPSPSTVWIHGWSIMTDEEREALRLMLLQAPTYETRMAASEEHRRRMEARAREQGKDVGPPHALELGQPMPPESDTAVPPPKKERDGSGEKRRP
jgi:hypothetical protein